MPKRPHPLWFQRPSALLVAALIAAAVPPADAALEDEAIDTRRALDLAAKGNLDLRREQIAIRLSQANLLATYGKFDLVLGSDLTFSQRITPSLNERDIASGVSNAFELQLSLDRQLETGGSISFGLSGSATDTTSALQCGVDTRMGVPTNVECLYYSTNFNLRFNHPLLRGFGPEFAQADIRRRRVQADMALLTRQARVATILRDVLSAYWELSYAARDLEIRRSAVDLAHKQLEATDAQIEVGRLAPIDRAAVQRAINDRLQEVALAEQQVYFRSLELRRLFGLRAEPGAPRYRAAEVPSAEPAAVDVATQLDRALKNSPQLLSLKRGLELNEVDILVAQSLLKPQLDVFGQFGTTGRNRDFAETLNQAVHFDNLVWQTGLSFRMPLQNRAAHGQREAVRQNQERAWVDADALELDIRDTLLRVSSNIDTASKRIELARAAVEFAQKNLEAEEARFAVGRTTNNDVLLRQQELKVAEIQVVRATVDLLKSEIALQAITGDILESHGVSLR